MNPHLNSLAYKLLAEELAESDQHQEHKSEWSKNLRRHVGGLLVTLGQKIQSSEPDAHMAFADGRSPALDELCV